uniref:Uncharacterized protein n=1 Tax=Aegilops tauschii subsp. strangulata TaxID=200361 RepID=A0A453IV69_AEGTS
MFDEGQIQGAAKSNEEMNISDVMLASFEQLPRICEEKAWLMVVSNSISYLSVI